MSASESALRVRYWFPLISSFTAVLFSAGGVNNLPAGDGGERLILVAGGGDYAGNPIATQTRELADRFHRVAMLRGFDGQDIVHLTAFAPNDGGESLATGEATASRLSDAISAAAADGVSLLHLVMIGHTIVEENSFAPEFGVWNFILNGDAANFEKIAATDLDQLLDQAQSGKSGIDRIVLTVDSSGSGGFLLQCGAAPEDRSRIVLSSASFTGSANFGSSTGVVSFTATLLSHLAAGESYGESFQQAWDALHIIESPSFDPQTPMIDANGDGLLSAEDWEIAGLVDLGEPSSAPVTIPSILDISGGAFVDPGTDFDLWADVPTEGVSSVFAYVTSYAAVHFEGQPNIRFAEVELLPSPEIPGRWEGTIPGYALRSPGPHIAAVYPFNDESKVLLQGAPALCRLSVGSTLTPDFYDQFMNDDSPGGTANYLMVGDVQYHTLHSAKDQDWVRFATPYGQDTDYTIQIKLPAFNSRIDPVIEVRDENGFLLHGPINDFGAGETEEIQLFLPGPAELRIGVYHDGASIPSEEAYYLLQIWGGVGKSVGIGTVTTRYVPAFAADLILRSGDPPFAGSLNRSTGAYPNAGLHIPSGTLSRGQMVTFGNLFDAYSCDKTLAASTAWHAEPHRIYNRTTVQVQFGDMAFSEGLTEFSPALDLVLEFAPSGGVLGCGEPIDDVPEGFRRQIAQILVWNPKQQEWQIYDSNPTRIGSGVFRTTISDLSPWIDPTHGYGVFFGLEPIPGSDSVTMWTIY